ncbi:hypothetical protein F5148DRAFT_192728 [Russula earlei]|uniref:Uncharacterized protein n=1 Tax=Russula earlei TaxID=71964 RepID=A0ACC0U569_9AGAM|nr:hypothetical protein F5148DRAFT_192728 [Russula earlei]
MSFWRASPVGYLKRGRSRSDLMLVPSVRLVMAEATLCAGDTARGLKAGPGNNGKGYSGGTDGAAYIEGSDGTESVSGWAEMGVFECSEGSPEGMPLTGVCERDGDVWPGGGTCAGVVRRRNIKEMKWNQRHARLVFHSGRWTPYHRVDRSRAGVFRATARRVPDGGSRRRGGDQCYSRFEGWQN